MPWTFAHPAAVLPLRRLGLSGAGLVIGSLAPDFGYYLGLFELATWAHAWWGVALICLPSAWLVHRLWLWAWRPLAGLLPSRHREALVTHAPVRPGLGIFGLSAALGAATHALWDAFTHRTGWFVQHWPWLREPLAPGLPAFQALQHASTLIGCAALLITYWRWLPAGHEPEDARCWRDLLLLAGAVLAVAWLAVGAPWRAHFHFLIVATDAWLLGALALAFWRQR